MGYPIRVRSTAVIIEHNAILLIEYNDQNGLHYNLPGGGVQAGESVQEALQRELREEACCEVAVEELLWAYEYAPHLDQFRFGDTPSLSLCFVCKRLSDYRMPEQPDEWQTAVKFLPLTDLPTVTLYPELFVPPILHYAQTGQPLQRYWREGNG